MKIFHEFVKGSKVVKLNDIVKEYHPKADDLNFEYLTQDADNVTIPLYDSEYLFNHPKFRMNWNVVLFVSGWNVNASNETITAMYNAYRCRGGYNFLVRIFDHKNVSILHCCFMARSWTLPNLLIQCTLGQNLVPSRLAN